VGGIQEFDVKVLYKKKNILIIDAGH
jgi:hypothetical protein